MFVFNTFTTLHNIIYYFYNKKTHTIFRKPKKKPSSILTLRESENKKCHIAELKCCEDFSYPAAK